MYGLAPTNRSRAKSVFTAVITRFCYLFSQNQMQKKDVKRCRIIYKPRISMKFSR
ncbi:hypothetical protein CAMRE0001_2953 [Campylobacter rectus RM3267]|uniref:Uncharacterized protein n=1 Tax=Campylobacter rectus RM3267 TaxID=553218 RepID=B9D2A9_CAMRE|nr:hypothetical protein CAMRE0001_2953 [Campylobacter rectus RM3267]